MNLNNFKWTRLPKDYKITEDTITITTAEHTDLWQRTYYHFRNDNAPVLQLESDEKYFSFVVKTSFEETNHRYDQCGIVMYMDSDNWIKASVEYETDTISHLGSVVTNNGYSDWATTEISSNVKNMWYRLSRREDDYRIECSDDGKNWKQMRICHFYKGDKIVKFGIYACSPETSSFTAYFSNFELSDCKWNAHIGE